MNNYPMNYALALIEDYIFVMKGIKIRAKAPRTEQDMEAFSKIATVVFNFNNIP